MDVMTGLTAIRGRLFPRPPARLPVFQGEPMVPPSALLCPSGQIITARRWTPVSCDEPLLFHADGSQCRCRSTP